MSPDNNRTFSFFIVDRIYKELLTPCKVNSYFKQTIALKKFRIAAGFYFAINFRRKAVPRESDSVDFDNLIYNNRCLGHC